MISKKFMILIFPLIAGLAIIFNCLYIPKNTRASTVDLRVSVKPAITPFLTVKSIEKYSNVGIKKILGTAPATISKKQHLIIKGITNPNAIIYITIKPRLIQTKLVADSDGKWEYIISPRELNLSYGHYTLEAKVQFGDKISDSSLITEFQVRRLRYQQEELESYNYIFYIVSICIAFLLFNFLLIILSRRYGGWKSMLRLKNN